MQSGCCGYTYGAQGCWNAAWESSDMQAYWGDLPWHAGIDLPRADQLGHLRLFYENVGWSCLRPDPDAWTTTNVFNTALYPPLVSSSKDRQAVVAFFSQTFRRDGSEASLVGLAEQPYRLQWFDPRTGHFIRMQDGAWPLDGALRVPDPPDGQTGSTSLAQVMPHEVSRADPSRPHRPRTVLGHEPPGWHARHLWLRRCH